MQLADYLNGAFGTNLHYREMTPEGFIADRSADLGPFIGPIIGGIYEGIQRGIYNAPSGYEAVMGGPHQAWDDDFRRLAT